jgi:hypothetical protein
MVTMKSMPTTFCNVTPCSQVDHSRFEGTYRLQLQGLRLSGQPASILRLHGLFFDPEDGGNMFLRNFGKLRTDYIELNSTILTILLFLFLWLVLLL